MAAGPEATASRLSSDHAIVLGTAGLLYRPWLFSGGNIASWAKACLLR